MSGAFPLMELVQVDQNISIRETVVRVDSFFSVLVFFSDFFAVLSKCLQGNCGRLSWSHPQFGDAE